MVRMLIAALLLVGCTQTPAASPTGVPPSSAAASPTYTCSPAGGTPAPCSKDEYDKVQSENALIAEAEAVYRKFWDENVRIYKTGGVTEPTPVLLETTTGMFLDSALAQYESVIAESAKAVGTARLVSVKPRKDLSHDQSLAAFDTCTDATDLVFKSGDKTVAKGPIARDIVYLKRVDGLLKLFYVESEVLKSCS